MNIQRAAPVNELLAKLLFLILPTALVGYFLLWHAHQFYSGLQDSSLSMALYFAAGMTGAALFYAFRFRFLPTFALLLFACFAIFKGIDNLAIGEFDAPVLEVRFLTFSVLFCLGWLFGWGFLRLRYWSVLVAAVMLTAGIFMIAKAKTDTVPALLWSFSPLVLYAVYLLFTAEQIYSYKDKSQKFWWFLSRRLAVFAVLAALVFSGVAWVMRKDLEETVANYGGGGKPGGNSMLKANKNGTFDLQEYTRLRSSLGRSNELLFCARIDNFFEGTDLPNPLYLTAFYYTRFDTLTETFERDDRLPKSDLFAPDPSKLSLFATKSDSSVVRNSGTDKLGKTVDVEIYGRKLSPGTYLAPHTGYFVQPITVEREFRDSFKYAFRAKSWVSKLNSAYFVYNTPDPQIRAFQEMRFAELRKVTSFSGLDPTFTAYYTFMPRDAKFQRISDLAHQLTANAKTPVDQVLALRDWFLSKDAGGQPLFKYSDNPGIPDIPNASKLNYFLFENRKGYCSYYAGATLFLLRSLGIPSRIAAGFITQDRSDKNKGWYWYYADQAHAWVQVYFPGYGWLDFDTTVGNTEAQESPKPDGTPPMQPPRAYLVADGIVERVDTVQQLLTMQVKHLLYHDKEYKLDPAHTATMDVHVAAIRRDSIDVPLASIRAGERASAVSYAEAFKNLGARPGEAGEALIGRFPDPQPIDEVYLQRLEQKAKADKPKTEQPEKPASVRDILLLAGGILGALIALFFAWPALAFAYYRSRARNAGDPGRKAYWTYQAASFYLHQLGFFRGTRTPMQYAREVVDPALGTHFASFMNHYLKQKYAGQPLNEREAAEVAAFLPAFLTAVRQRVRTGKRLAAFLNPLRTISFYVRGSDDEERGA